MVGCIMNVGYRFDVFFFNFRVCQASNHVELSSTFNSVTLAKLCKYTSEQIDAKDVAKNFENDFVLNMSLSRFGEMLFRVSFPKPILYEKKQDEMVKKIILIYMNLFSKIASGNGIFLVKLFV